MRVSDLSSHRMTLEYNSPQMTLLLHNLLDSHSMKKILLREICRTTFTENTCFISIKFAGNNILCQWKRKRSCHQNNMKN